MKKYCETLSTWSHMKGPRPFGQPSKTKNLINVVSRLCKKLMTGKSLKQNVANDQNTQTKVNYYYTVIIP